MEKVGGTRHERIIIGLIVVLVVVELLAWLRPQPYRWSEATMGTSVIELDGRYYLQTDAGSPLVDITEEYADELRK